MYYILLMIMMGVSMLASAKVSSNYAKYSRVRSSSGLTGEQAARKILEQNGIYDVDIQPINGHLTDHYDPRDKTIRLSENVYGSDSVSAVSIAAHEVGHAIQDNEGYAFLRFRSALVPVVNFTSRFTFILIMLGLFLNIVRLVDLGIILFSASVLFHVVTLPVEFDASNRAMKHLENYSIISSEEKTGTKKVLGAAAMTYVASTLVSVIQLLRFMSMRNNRN
ncbi:zinc metallopeptidase [uncultured Helcococcus sp.]|uniref:zinc metallopeptidase n=1 Tax=uncultured Helcococcus sp. TaxID=1072508 RepID=UPI0026064A9D|nr:zinc metallopeptidase [uncultured Helcococcus sp.]